MKIIYLFNKFSSPKGESSKEAFPAYKFFDVAKFEEKKMLQELYLDEDFNEISNMSIEELNNELNEAGIDPSVFMSELNGLTSNKVTQISKYKKTVNTVDFSPFLLKAVEKMKMDHVTLGNRKSNSKRKPDSFFSSNYYKSAYSLLPLIFIMFSVLVPFLITYKYPLVSNPSLEVGNIMSEELYPDILHDESLTLKTAMGFFQGQDSSYIGPAYWKAYLRVSGFKEDFLSVNNHLENPTCSSNLKSDSNYYRPCSIISFVKSDLLGSKQKNITIAEGDTFYKILEDKNIKFFDDNLYDELRFISAGDKIEILKSNKSLSSVKYIPVRGNVRNYKIKNGKVVSRKEEKINLLFKDISINVVIKESLYSSILDTPYFSENIDLAKKVAVLADLKFGSKLNFRRFNVDTVVNMSIKSVYDEGSNKLVDVDSIKNVEVISPSKSVASIGI